MCFDYDDQHGLIATGSSDSKIRLWSPTHQAKCWMVLRGHSSAIAAVLIHEKNFLWSICDQSVRKTELHNVKSLNNYLHAVCCRVGAALLGTQSRPNTLENQFKFSIHSKQDSSSVQPETIADCGNVIVHFLWRCRGYRSVANGEK